MAYGTMRDRMHVRPLSIGFSALEVRSMNPKNAFQEVGNPKRVRSTRFVL